MRVFATSDIHGNQTIIDNLGSVAKDVDMVVICGDIGGKEHFRKGATLRSISAGQRNDAVRLVDKMRELSVPFRYILGNDDWFDCGGKYYLKARETISGYEFVPFDLVPITPFSTNREANEYKIQYELGKLKGGKNTVVVAHAPPYRCCDTLYDGTFIGSRAISEWIYYERPRVWLCGHIHEAYGAVRVDDTMVFNCACDHLNSELRGWIIDLDSMEYERVRM